MRETLETQCRRLSDGLKSLPKATPDNLPEVLTGIERLEATQKLALTAAEQLTSPGTANIGEIARLMMHYPSQFSADGVAGKGAELVAGIQQSVRGDWAEDIAEYPGWVVSEACKVWRRSEQGKFRPSIAEFRHICDGLVAPILLDKRAAEMALENARRKARQDAYFESERLKRFKPRTEQPQTAAGADVGAQEKVGA